MGLWEIIKSKMPKKEETKLLEGLDEVKETFEEADTRKEAIEAAAQRAIEKMKEHPDMSAIEFLRLIQEEEDLPTAIIGEVAKKMPEELSEATVVQAVKELDLEAETIQEIIQETDVSISTEQSLVNQITDKEIKQEEQEKLSKRKEKKNLERLEAIYEDCTQLTDLALVDRIQKINITEMTAKVQSKIEHIIAKKTADNCMKYGGPKILTMAQIIPVEEMLEINFPYVVEKEYQLLKKDYIDEEKKYHEYDPQILKNKILENIAKNVARKYEDIGDINVPQSAQMKKITPDEENLFIKTAEVTARGTLKENDISKIRKQIRGEITTQIDDLIKMFEKIPVDQKDEYLNKFRNQLQERGRKTAEEQTAEIAIDTLTQKLKTLSPKECTKVANMMTNILKERESAMKVMDPKQNSRIEELKKTEEKEEENSL